MKKHFPFSLGSFILIPEDAHDAALGLRVFIVPGGKLGPEIRVLILF